jgi:hypothetical protein
VGLRRRRRTDSPQHPKRLVPTLPQATVPLTGALYLRRGSVALGIKALKSGVGLGHHQVAKDGARVARSVAAAVMADLLLLRRRAQQLKPGPAGSAVTLKQELAREWGHNATARHDPARSAKGNAPAIHC